MTTPPCRSWPCTFHALGHPLQPRHAKSIRRPRQRQCLFFLDLLSGGSPKVCNRVHGNVKDPNCIQCSHPTIIKIGVAFLHKLLDTDGNSPTFPCPCCGIQKHDSNWEIQWQRYFRNSPRAIIACFTDHRQLTKTIAETTTRESITTTPFPIRKTQIGYRLNSGQILEQIFIFLFSFPLSWLCRSSGRAHRVLKGACNN